MTRHRVAIVLTVLLGAWTVVEAQSLAEVARKEEERRARLTKPAPVYTNKDLSQAAASEPTRSSPAAPKDPIRESVTETSAGERGAGEAPATEVPKAREKRDERHWRERAALIRERLDRLRADTGALQMRMTALKTDAVSAPPAGTAALKNELVVATADFLRFQTELQLIEQEWTTFEQRAREANVPPRWLQR